MPHPDDPHRASGFEGEAHTVVQAGAVHGDVHINTRHEWPTPRQLPAPPSGFVNRTAQFRLLDEALGDDPNPIRTLSAVTGPPGIGKTALALRWAHRVRDRFPDGDLYVDMHSYGPGSPLTAEQALDCFLRSFGIDPDLMPESLDERASLYRSLTGGKRMLIVLDNTMSARQIRRLLPGSPGCLTLVTSRSSLTSLVAREGAVRMPLDVLSIEDALELVAEVIDDGRAESDEAGALRVVERCGRLPLALRVVAERASARPHLTMSDLADELAAEQVRLDALSADEDELVDVRAVFSWSYRSLDSRQRRVFRFLGLHRGVEMSAAPVAVLTGTPLPELRRHLGELCDAHLVQQTGTDRFQLHDLLRVYAVERCQREEAERTRTDAVRRMMGWYLHAADRARQAILPYSNAVPLVPVESDSIPQFEDGRQAMDWFGVERLNLLSLLDQAMDLGQYDIAWKLPVVADGLFELGSYRVEWRETHEEGVKAAATIGDDLGIAANLLGLGDCHWQAGRRAEARDVYERCAAIADRIGHLWIAAFSERGLGHLALEDGDPESAKARFNRALELFGTGGYPRGEGQALRSLAEAHEAQGEGEASLAFARDAVAKYASIDDPWSLAWGRLAFGRIAGANGLLDEAETALRQSIETFRHLNDLRTTARGLHPLGVVLDAKGLTAEARGCWEEAFAILEPLDYPGIDELRRLLGFDEVRE